MKLFALLAAVPLVTGDAPVLDRWNFCNPPPYDCSPVGISENADAIFYDCSCVIDAEGDFAGYAHYQRTSQLRDWIPDTPACSRLLLSVNRWGSAHNPQLKGHLSGTITHDFAGYCCEPDDGCDCAPADVCR
jgi:hypothetical protein